MNGVGDTVAAMATRPTPIGIDRHRSAAEGVVPGTARKPTPAATRSCSPSFSATGPTARPPVEAADRSLRLARRGGARPSGRAAPRRRRSARRAAPGRGRRARAAPGAKLAGSTRGRSARRPTSLSRSSTPWAPSSARSFASSCSTRATPSPRSGRCTWATWPARRSASARSIATPCAPALRRSSWPTTIRAATRLRRARTCGSPPSSRKPGACSTSSFSTTSSSAAAAG